MKTILILPIMLCIVAVAIVACMIFGGVDLIFGEGAGARDYK